MTTKKAYRYDPSASYTVREYDVEYLRVGGVTRQVRIYQPEGPGPFPILMSVHGGAWSAGDHTNNPFTSKPLAFSSAATRKPSSRVSPATKRRAKPRRMPVRPMGSVKTFLVESQKMNLRSAIWFTRFAGRSSGHTPVLERHYT